MTTRRCGRIGDHEPHRWTRRSHGSQPMRSYDCPGSVVTEMSGAKKEATCHE